MDNQDWTQPDGNVAAINGATSSTGPSGTTSWTGASGTSTTGTVGSGQQQIKNNPAAPFINGLINPSSTLSTQVSYASKYVNVLSNSAGNGPSIHPSEPNYLWQESGTNYGIANDNDPYGSTNNAAIIQSYIATASPAVSGQNLSGLLQAKGISWKSYQEDTDLTTTGGLTETNVNQAAYNGHLAGTANDVTSTPVGPSQYTVPLTSFSGTSTNYTNPYNGSHQYNFAVKHDGSLFYADTNGGNVGDTTNTEASHYLPLQQLQTDLTNNTVGQYNLITPDQYNDMHTALSGGFSYQGVHYTGEGAQIAQGDNFLATVVPEIEASSAYTNNGAIVIWTDETELDSTGGSQNDYNHTLMEIVISPLAKGDAYTNSIVYTHSSDLATLQEVYNVPGSAGAYLNDAGAATDLSDLFQANVIPAPIPEPASVGLMTMGALGFLARRRRAAKAL